MNAALHNSVQYGLTFTAGFLTRPCCVIPAALSVVGAGGAGVAAALAPWRPWFIAFAVAFFAVSFYWNFVRNGNRAGMVVWFASAIIAAFLLAGPALSGRFATLSPPILETSVMADNLTHTRIPVEGMACEACVSRLKTLIADADGVRDVDVELKPGRAHVSYDPQRFDVARLEEVIRTAGFKADISRAETR